MRIALAVLAWVILVVVVLGSLISVASEMVAMQQVGAGSATRAVTLTLGLIHALFNVLIGVGIWAALLYLLNVDKRLRAVGVARETF